MVCMVLARSEILGCSTSSLRGDPLAIPEIHPLFLRQPMANNEKASRTKAYE